MSRYPAWLRDRLYALAIEANIQPPGGVYTRPSIRPAAFYEPFGVQFVWDLPYSGYAVLVVGERPDLVRGFLENMTDLQVLKGPDAGMLPRSVTWDGDQAGQDGSQVPLLAWLAHEVHQRDPDTSWLARVYPRLAASADWWQSPRRDVDGDGLSEYAGSSPTYAVYESGHDYSPERDLVMAGPTLPSPDGLVHEPFADVFLNASLYAELVALGCLSEVVDPLRTAEWRARAALLRARMHEAMWCEEVGGFFPVLRRDLWPTQPRVYRHTPAMLQPLWSGVATQEQADATVATLCGRLRDYPFADGELVVRLGPAYYQGYQVVTDGLHPTRGVGPSAGGVDLTDHSAVLRFGLDRGPAAAAFRRLEVVVQTAQSGPTAHVRAELVDGKGRRRVVVDGAPVEGVAGGAQGGDPLLDGPSWTDGVTELAVTVTGCTLTSVTLRYARFARTGLLSPYGVKSAHPLDGKHPAPGVPTDFWSGTVWGPHQLHMCQGLVRYGHTDLAKAQARAFSDAVAGAFASGAQAFEHLSAEDGLGLGTVGYTWTAGTALVLMRELLADDC